MNGLFLSVDTNLSSLIISIISCVISFATLLVAIFTLRATRVIAKKQKQKQDMDYLSNALIVPFNHIETDLILLSQGKNINLNKDNFDKEMLDGINQSKSYALMSNNRYMFEYLDGLLTGESKEQVGLFIDEYFEKRDKVVFEDACVNVDKGIAFRNEYLPKCRELRDNTLNSIKSFSK